MSRFFSEKYSGLDPYVPGEQPQDMKYVKLNTNESPYPPSPEVLSSLTKEKMERLRLYPDPESAELKSAIGKHFGFKSENVYVAAGSDDILNFAFAAFSKPGGKVYFPDISYGFYPVFASLHGLDAVEVPLREDFTVDPSDYYDADGMVVIANPNAPTGLALQLDDIEGILRHNRDNVVLVDEAYVDFGAESAASLTAKYDNLLVCQTYSKSRSMAGARLGYAFGDKSLIADLETIKFSTNPYNINSMTQAAGIAAVESSPYYDERCREIMKTRAHVTNELAARGFTVIPSLANFIFIKSDRISGKDLYTDLRSMGVLVRHFDKERIKEYNRVTIGTDEEMEIFIGAIDEILKGDRYEKE